MTINYHSFLVSRRINMLLAWLLVPWLSICGAPISYPNVRDMFRFAHFSAADGLASQRVFSIVEGSDHAIWIATKAGVERYNGMTMQPYSFGLNGKYNLASGRIIRLYKAADGTMYAFTNSGQIFRYNAVGDTFEQYCSLTQVFNHEIILNDIAVTDGKVWLALADGLYSYSPGDTPRTIIANAFVNCLTDAGGVMMAGTKSGLFLVATARHQASLLYPNIEVQSAYYDTETRQLWIGTFSEGLYIGNIAGKQPRVVCPDIPHRPIRAITPLDKSVMLVGVDGGGVTGVAQNDYRRMFVLSTDDASGSLLHGNGIYDICRDEWGNVWIGSYSGGVDIAYRKDDMVRIVAHEYLNPQSLANNNVNDIFDDGNGNIYYATDRGVSVFHAASLTWSHTLEGFVALTIARGLDGQILVGTYGGGVRTVGGATVYARSNGKLKTDYVFNIYNDGKGCLWIGCLDGDLVRATADGCQYYGIQNVQSITAMPDGRVAISTTNGFYAIDSHGHSCHYFTSGEFANHDINTYVMAMLFTSANEVWLATDGGGLYIYNMRLHSVRQMTTHEGLPSNSAKGLLADNRGRIWITTDHGMVYVNHKDGLKAMSIDLPETGGIEFNRAATTTLSDGSIAFGSTSGAVILQPDKAGRESYKAELELKDIDIAGINDSTAMELRPRIYDMLRKGKVTLPYSQNTFTLSFECINLRYQRDIGYEYSFGKGQDGEWQTANDGHILFNSLAPGTYNIHIRSIRKSGGQTLAERMLVLRIRQPWWNTWWAWTVYLLLLATVGYFSWRFYRNRLQRQYDTERINFFVNTAHDIRTPLSLTLAPLDDISNDKTLSESSRGYLDIARRNGHQLMTLITTLLDFQKVDMRKAQIHVRQLSLKDMLAKACARFNLLSQQKNITLTLGQCPDNQSVWIDPDAADKIFDNLLSNAIKYTRQNGNVVVSAHTDDSHIYIDVSDNGIGIPEKSKRNIFKNFYRAENALRMHAMGTGLGLMLVKRLVELHHGTVSFKSREGQGTTFTITLLKGFDHLQQFIDSENTPADNHIQRSKSNVQRPTSDVQRPTLLFVDDNTELRNYIRTTFGKDYNVITCPEAQATLDYLKENTCDIVISDVRMPGIPGNELCRRIKADSATSFIPVILLTANAGRDFTINGLSCGADDYVTKPFDIAILRAKVSSILRNRQAIREYYLGRATAIARKNDDTQHPSIITHQPTPDLALDDDDKKFIDDSTHIVLENMHDEDFDINALCRKMFMSRTVFYNRLKALTGKTPQDFIRILRLERAAKLLDEGRTVFEASTDTGFGNVKYFSTVFKKHFGTSPSKYHK